MPKGFAQNMENLEPFLPSEPGMRAHVCRVAALAGRSVSASGGSRQQVECVERAALLHHFRQPQEDAGTAKLLTALGVPIPVSLQPLPANVQESLDAAKDPALSGMVDSANLFDEQFENLPYESAETAQALEELVQSGMLSPAFVAALDSFRKTSYEQLRLASGFVNVSASRQQWLPATAELPLYAHCQDVERAAMALARDTDNISQEIAQTSGLFHDIGRVAFLQPELHASLNAWQGQQFPLVYAEFLISGTDHAAVGASMLGDWRFPESIVEAVRFHHRLELTDSRLAALLYHSENSDESLPSCARDYQSARRLERSIALRGKAGA